MVIPAKGKPLVERKLACDKVAERVIDGYHKVL